MTDLPAPSPPSSPCDAELIVEPRFTGRSFVAVLRVLVGDRSALVHKLDLAKDGARQTFAKMVTGRLPGVKAADVEEQLLKLCDDRAQQLRHAEELAAERGEEPTIVDLLVQIAEEAELFHDAAKDAYGTIQVDGHFEIWPVRSKGFRLWLRRRLREGHDKAAYSEALQSAIEEIESKALFECPQMEVNVRVAEADGAVWLDLADEAWRAVEITTTGWRVVEGKPPVRFVRAPGLLPLPVPQPGGRIEDLRAFLNVRDEADFVLLVSWLLACLRRRGPYPVLSVYGEQGSAKSTLQRLLRDLVDPNTAPLRSEPREVRDLIISASNSWVQAFDNLSRVPPWLSDALCRLSTGGGFATRELYSDRAETIFDAQRPVAINGITDLATRSDLLDRALNITLSAIPDDQRKDERTLQRSFEAARPRILGALLDAVSAGLRNEANVRLDRLPRMADFALWVTACEPALGWAPGAFLAAYTANRSLANNAAIEASIIGPVLQAFMATRSTWQSTSTELLAELEEVADDKTRHRKEWPGSPRKLSGDLRRIAPNLRAAGIDVDFSRSGKRLIHLGRISDGSDDVGAAPAADRPGDKALFENDLPPPEDGLDGLDGVSPTFSESQVQRLTEAEREALDERIAVCTIDGGLPEPAAEDIAQAQIDTQRGEKTPCVLRHTVARDQ